MWSPILQIKRFQSCEDNDIVETLDQDDNKNNLPLASLVCQLLR